MDIIADSLDIMMCGSGLSPAIQPITITQNGTYTAPAEIDGYSPIVVNVGNAIPNDYTILDYVITPSNASSCGFELLNYKSAVNDIIETTSIPLIDLNGNVFQVYASNDYIYQRYYNNSLTIMIRNNTGTDLLGTRPAEIGVEYPSKIRIDIDNRTAYVGCNPSPIAMKIGEFTVARTPIKQDGTTGDPLEIAHLVPVKQQSDNSVGMYDLIYGIFYKSTSTCPFVDYYYIIKNGETGVQVNIEASASQTWKIFKSLGTPALVTTGTGNSTEIITQSAGIMISVAGADRVTFTPIS